MNYYRYPEYTSSYTKNTFANNLAMLVVQRVTWLFALVSLASHHMTFDPVQWVSKRDSSLPMLVENYCNQVIYPAILTQAGEGPEVPGFKLNPGGSRRLTVSENWQGRVWGRTNCTFNANGTGPNPPGGPNGNGAACSTGDCGGIVKCNLAVSMRFYFDIAILNSKGLATSNSSRIQPKDLFWPGILRHFFS